MRLGLAVGPGNRRRAYRPVGRIPSVRSRSSGLLAALGAFRRALCAGRRPSRAFLGDGFGDVWDGAGFVGMWGLC